MRKPHHPENRNNVSVPAVLTATEIYALLPERFHARLRAVGTRGASVHTVGAFVVVLLTGSSMTSIGPSKRSPQDTYNELIGVRVALRRALEHLEGLQAATHGRGAQRDLDTLNNIIDHWSDDDV